MTPARGDTRTEPEAAMDSPTTVDPAAQKLAPEAFAERAQAI